MSDSKIKARLYIDGNFTVHIHKYLLKKFNKTIDWKAFQEYVKERISKEENKVCTLESHFFVGTGLETTDKDRDYLFNSMEHEGISKHATPLKKKVTGGLKEDAVDTNLVFYATKDYYNYGEYDYLVLLAGDSDFVPLVKGLAAEAVKTFVIYMDFEDKDLGKTQTAQVLLENSDLRENIESLLLERVDEKIKRIFLTKESSAEETNTNSVTTTKVSTKEENSVAEPLSIKKNSEFVIHKKETTVSITPEQQPKKTVVVRKKNNSNKENKKLPFTIDHLEQAIIKTQQNKCNGHNDYVLVAQVGENLKEIVKDRLHGKLFNMIKKNFPDEFDFDLSEKSAPKIRFKM